MLAAVDAGVGSAAASRGNPGHRPRRRTAAELPTPASAACEDPPPVPCVMIQPYMASETGNDFSAVNAQASSVIGSVVGSGLAPAALALYAKVVSASSLDAAAHRLVSALTADAGFTRASIGLHEHGVTRLLASTGLDLSNPQAELPQRLLGAMDEAIEQGITLSWPPAPAPLLSSSLSPLPSPAQEVSDPIRIEHQAMQRQTGGVVASVPLGVAGEVFAAVCVERDQGPPLSDAELLRLEQLLVLLAPVLRWMVFGTQPWHQRAWREILQAVSALRQPQRRVRRRVLALAALLLFFLAVVPLQDDVSGRARIEGAQQRIVSAPTDGYVKTAYVRPGDRVKVGDPLVDLVEGDLQLERGRWTSQIEQHENAYAAAMAKSDRVGASTSMARIGEAQAQLALVDEQLARGRIRAPFDALVIQGDLSQAVGAPVRQGDTLLTLATTAAFRVIVEIDEGDIARVHPGQAGQLVLSSLPWDRQQLVVERISPLSRAVEGRNVFEVETRLATAPGTNAAASPVDLRPGLIGRAELVTGRKPPLWAWTRHLLDRIRLTWWSWLG
jgi:multidrug efflux pump subunit AcrA (membrane-fusion protein)